MLYYYNFLLFSFIYSFHAFVVLIQNNSHFGNFSKISALSIMILLTHAVAFSFWILPLADISEYREHSLSCLSQIFMFSQQKMEKCS